MSVLCLMHSFIYFHACLTSLLFLYFSFHLTSCLMFTALCYYHAMHGPSFSFYGSAWCTPLMPAAIYLVYVGIYTGWFCYSSVCPKKSNKFRILFYSILFYFISCLIWLKHLVSQLPRCYLLTRHMFALCLTYSFSHFMLCLASPSSLCFSFVITTCLMFTALFSFPCSAWLCTSLPFYGYDWCIPLICICCHICT